MIKLTFIVAILLLIVLVILLARTLKSLPQSEKNNRRAILRRRLNVGTAAVLLLMLLCGIWSILIEPNRLIVHRESIQIQNWPQEMSGLRIALIGDIHTGSPFIDDNKLARIVELTNQEKPDLIVLLGDYMTGNGWLRHRVEPEITARDLQTLRAPLGVFAVLGNHDWWYNGERVRRAFDDRGIKVLENQAVEIRFGAGSFWLVGLGDLWTRPQHVTETLATIPPGAATIALTHNPDLFPRLPSTVQLLLAAHTHGGQVNFPLWGTPIVPSNYGRKYTAGHVFENGHHLFVTTGIGTSIVAIRFRVTPEIIILTIQS